MHARAVLGAGWHLQTMSRGVPGAAVPLTPKPQKRLVCAGRALPSGPLVESGDSEEELGVTLGSGASLCDMDRETPRVPRTHALKPTASRWGCIWR